MTGVQTCALPISKKELKQKMLDYIARQDALDKDEWYGTQRELAEYVLVQFALDELDMYLDGE